jgi:TonB-dependent receptor
VKPGTIDAASTTTDATIRNAGVDVFDDYSDQVAQSYGYVGTVEHRFGPWRIDYTANYAKSDAKVTDLPAMIQSVQFNLVAAQGVGIHLTANPDTPAPVTMVQTAGPDLYDLHSYTNTTGLSLQTSPRFQNDRTWNLAFNARRDFPNVRFPFDLRAGASLYQLHRQKQAGQIVLNFLGPDGIAGTADDGPNAFNAYQFNDTTYGDKFLYGIRTPPLLDPFKVAAYMKANPLAIQDISSANIARRFTNSQQLSQDITSAYLASTVKVTSRLTLMGGARAEQTEVFARGLYRVNSATKGITDALQQQLALFSQTQRATNKYTDYFPNFQATYRFTPDLLFRGAVTRSMSRPGVQTILPNTTVNDTATIPSVSVNNTALLPTYSRNIDFQLELYTRPAGTVSLGWFKKDITNYIITETTVIQPGNDNGFDGQYAGYNLTTQDNGGKGQFEGIELSMRQSLQPWLKFAPEPLRGWEVFGGYNKNYKGQAPNRAGVITKPLAPNFYDWNANWGVSYMTPRRKFYVNVRTTIFPQAITTAATTTDLRPTFESRHQRWDATVRWTFSQTYSVELTGANLTDDSWRNFYRSGRNESRRTFGTNYSLSFKANLDNLRLPFLPQAQ